MRRLFLAIGLFLAVSTSFSQSIDTTFTSVKQEYWTIDEDATYLVEANETIVFNSDSIVLFPNTDLTFVVNFITNPCVYVKDGQTFTEYTGFDSDGYSARVSYITKGSLSVIFIEGHNYIMKFRM